MTTQECPPDKPLDLSDRGRCRDSLKSTSQPLPLNTTAAHAPSPQLPTLSRPVIHSPHTLNNGNTQARTQEPEEHSTPKVRVPVLALFSMPLHYRMAFTSPWAAFSLMHQFVPKSSLTVLFTLGKD